MRFLLYCFFALFSNHYISAQDTWSLERCVERAYDQNFSIQLAESQVELAEANLKSSRMNQLPSVDASGNLGWQFGRTVDPTTNTFDNQRIGFNSYQLNAGMILFKGASLQKQTKIDQLSARAAKEDLDFNKNTTALNVANAYLNALMTQEQLDNARRQKTLTSQQLNRTRILVQNGAMAPNDSLSLIAQLAANEQSIVQFENMYAINLLTLKQLLQIHAEEDIVLAQADFSQLELPVATAQVSEEVFNQALQNQPEIKAAKLRQESSALSVDQAQGLMYPTVSAFASMSSNYSSAFSDFANPDLSGSEVVLNTPVPVEINGAPAQLASFSIEGITFPTLPFWDQIENNFGQSLGMAVSIPIFNSGQGRIQKERALINQNIAAIQYQQAEQTLRVQIEQAVTDLKAAYSSYLAAEATVEAAELAFNAEKSKYGIGSSSTYDFNTAQINLQNAESDLIRSKYQYLFSLKIIDFYLGKPIR